MPQETSSTEAQGQVAYTLQVCIYLYITEPQYYPIIYNHVLYINNVTLRFLCFTILLLTFVPVLLILLFSIVPYSTSMVSLQHRGNLSFSIFILGLKDTNYGYLAIRFAPTRPSWKTRHLRVFPEGSRIKG